MGTGYCLDEYKDPIHILNILNRFAIESAESGKEDRPVGNMATLSVYHPKIEKFINYKSRNLEVMEWKFNLAINVDKYFLEQARKGKNFKLSNGKVKNAKDILRKIADNNFTCGDPGLLFLDNLNKENPAAFLGEYKTVAPCGEVGLLPGEACQFGYINLARFAKDNKELDWKKMSLAVSVLVRSLDNALDITIRNLTDKTSKELIRQKRKIGIGNCGLSELFINLNIPYDSRKAQKIARDIMAFVNYSSKEESHSLAKEKGSCKAMDHIECGYRNGFLLKYAKNTRKVSKKMWVELHDKIAATLKLRNIITTALPPTGRSALVIDTSTGIEPTFSIYDHGGEIRSDLSRLLAGLNLSQEDIAKIKSTGKLNRKIPRKIRRIYKTALQIPVKKHLSMVSTIQEYVDESISKTVNLPENCTTQEMINAMHLAYDNGLKGISLYRSNSRKLQPRKL
jgi:ribonucleoside-diphosphate reductase alpha chain